MQSQNLYFIAIIPQGTATGDITAFKEHIARLYNSHKALRVMPHITLKAPFTLAQAQHQDMLRWFAGVNTKIAPFTISLNGFGAFNNPNNPVLYCKPVAHSQLSALQFGIVQSFQEQFPAIPLHYHEHHFSPHITIAYRDLTPEMFVKAWAEFEHKEYKTEFEVHSFFLLQHNGTKWNIIAKNKLQ